MNSSIEASLQVSYTLSSWGWSVLRDNVILAEDTTHTTKQYTHLADIHLHAKRVTLNLEKLVSLCSININFWFVRLQGLFMNAQIDQFFLSFFSLNIIFVYKDVKGWHYMLSTYLWGSRTWELLAFMCMLLGGNYNICMVESMVEGNKTREKWIFCKTHEWSWEREGIERKWIYHRWILTILFDFGDCN